MFDTVVERPRNPFQPQSINANIRIDEHRAPTDKSIELLQEMEKKLTDNLISKSILDSNTLKMKWYVYDVPMLMQREIKCAFELNGEQHIFKVMIPEEHEMEIKKENVWMKIAEELQKKFATIFTLDLIKNHHQEISNPNRHRI